VVSPNPAGLFGEEARVKNISVFSYGGGIQSTAALVLAVQGKIAYPIFLFCNVGQDAENPDTLRYVNEVARPYAHAHGLTFLELQKRRRNGELDSLYGRLTRPGSSSIGIPVRLESGAPAKRACTMDFKIRVVASWTKQHGATAEHPATVGLGISLDEVQRMRSDSGIAHERVAYPLIDLRLDRAACVQIIRQAGLPVPPKSSCWFCPFHSMQTWQAMRQQQPALFAKAVALERMVNDKRARQGRGPVWFTDKLKPLETVTTDLTQEELFEEMEVCESGYCLV
jgi:hypothetical protein